MVEMDQTRDMDAVTSLGLLSNKSEIVVEFEKLLWDVGVAISSGEAGTLNESGRLQVRGNVGCSRLEDLHVVFQVKRDCIFSDALDELGETRVAPEHGGHGVAVALEHNNFMHQQQFLTFPPDVAHKDFGQTGPYRLTRECDIKRLKRKRLSNNPILQSSINIICLFSLDSTALKG